MTTVVMVMLGVLVFAQHAGADDDGNSVQIGVTWVGKYTGTGAPAAQYGDLATSDDCVAGLYKVVSDSRTNWGWAFNWGNANAWELDWKADRLGGNDYRLVDDVDLAAFSGHGRGRNFQMATKRNDWTVTASEMDLGDRDLEWALAFTCNFLNGTMDQLGQAADGVHLMCGYATDMTITANGGSKFAEFAMPTATRQAYGVRVAWYKYGQTTQAAANENVARTFGAKTAVNDYLWGYGSVAADPLAWSRSPSSYTYWDTRLNW